MKQTTIKEINEYKSKSIDPRKEPETVFEMYSVPAYSTGHPEYLSGEQIASNKVIVEKNDILLCKINPRINRVWVVQDESEKQNIASSEWIVIRTKKYNPEYLAWYFQSPKFKQLMVSEVTGIGGSLTRAQPKRVANYPVPNIEREKQDEIVKRLNLLHDSIQKRKEEIQLFDELIKARFVEMFGTFPTNEKKWETGIIKDLVNEVRYGSSRKAAEGNSGKYPYLRMNNITYNGELDLTDTKTIDIPDKELDKCTVRRGDLLFNRTNSKELVGKTCVYNRDEIMVLAGFVVRVRLNKKALPEFVSAFLNTDFSKKMLLNKCKTAIGQANINAQELQSIGIYIPPIEKQKKFVSFKAQVDKSKAVIQKSIDQTQMLFDSLMQEYFS